MYIYTNIEVNTNNKEICPQYNGSTFRIWLHKINKQTNIN